jgi:excisionase family DNA binding protein
MKTTKQAAKELGYSSDAVIRLMIKQGKMSADKFGHIWLIHDSELNRLKKERLAKHTK